MRSVIFISIAMFLAVIGSGYCMLWYTQSQALKSNIEQAINHINEKQKYLTYDAIEISGFPTKINAAIVKPHFKGRVDTLLQRLQQPGMKPFSAWDEEDTLDGRITFSVNALADTYVLSMNGNWLENSVINGQAVNSQHQQTGNTSCVLQIHRSLAFVTQLWNFQSLIDDPKQLFSELRMFDCNHAGSTTINPTTKQVMTSSGPLRLYVTNDESANSRKVRVYGKSVDAFITPEGDAMISQYIRAVSPDYFYPVTFSAYGKQNAEIDFVYNGPASPAGFTPNAPANIELVKFDIVNNMYNSHMHFLFNNGGNASAHTTKLAFKAESTFSEQYDAMMQTMLRAFIQQVHESKDPQFAQMQEQMKAYTPDQVYSIVYPALFSFHALGNIVQALDVNYQGSADFVSGDIALNSLDLSATPYGISGSGNAKIANKMPQTGSAKLACANCLAMIDDAVAYAGRIQKVMSYFAPDKAAQMNIDPNQVDGLKKFLSALALPTNDTTLRYEIVSDPTNGITINGKKLLEVMMMKNQYFVQPAQQLPTH